jgi:GTP-binding protein
MRAFMERAGEVFGGCAEAQNRRILQCRMTDSTKPAADAASSARQALAWAHGARFLTTAARLDQVPVLELPEIAFVGRSNAGKSTAINTLAQRKRLAFASKTPGRTQHINLFLVGPLEQPDAVFADLPGYGYAAVERDAKLRWQQVMADYLAERRDLTGVVLLADSRLGLTDLDHRLLEWISSRLRNGTVKLLVLLTKADKLSRKEADASLNATTAALGAYATDESDIGVVLFSALKRTGLDDAAQTLYAWAHP